MTTVLTEASRCELSPALITFAPRRADSGRLSAAADPRFRRICWVFYSARPFSVRRVGGMGKALKIGITGLPGAGKTYCLLKVMEMLEADGLKVGGMITEPIVKRNRREGFYVMDWATKEKRVFESPNFVQSVKDALDADKPLLLTLHKKSRNPLLQDIRRRDDVRILEVTMVNRNLLPYKIVKLMKGEVL